MCPSGWVGGSVYPHPGSKPLMHDTGAPEADSPQFYIRMPVGQWSEPSVHLIILAEGLEFV